ncbi:DNA-directed RNA polymerase sigma-70 factor [Bacteroidia bacterium]|nr:DNA-directed RNA polymerase sigma-70 factor [Bacteroidia bacterium]
MNVTPSKEIEKNLVARLIRDDESAFCELYALYKNRLIYFAMKYLKSKDAAEDICQDVFTVIWQTRQFINPDLPFSAYLYTIVRNRILNLLRNIDTEKRLKEHILSQAIDYPNDIYDKLAESDFWNLIASAMSKLTDKQREVFDMSRNKLMSHKEIATELNISPNTVQTHISNALKILQNYLRQHYSQYPELILILCWLNR